MIMMIATVIQFHIHCFAHILASNCTNCKENGDNCVNCGDNCGDNSTVAHCVANLIAMTCTDCKENCNVETWFGFGDFGSEKSANVSAIFKGTGTAELNFGNCGISRKTKDKSKDRPRESHVWVYRNEKKIGGAWPALLDTSIKFPYKPGDKLTIEATGFGIMQLNSLVLECV